MNKAQVTDAIDDPIRESELKIREEFNNCPGGDFITHYLYEHRIADMVSYIDISEEHSSFWQNNSATMVFTVKDGDNPQVREKAILAISKFANDNAVDEFNYIYIGFGEDRTLAIRLWWD